MSWFDETDSRGDKLVVYDDGSIYFKNAGASSGRAYPPGSLVLDLASIPSLNLPDGHLFFLTEEQLKARAWEGPNEGQGTMKPRFTTVPQDALWQVVDQFTKGLTSTQNPEKTRGHYGWRATAKEHGLEQARLMYQDSLMRHYRNKEWAAVAANALILADLEMQEEE